MAGKVQLRQVQIRNYKNIAAAVVELQPLTVLVGPNGAGKSNFVDALAFVADSLNHSIQSAFVKRGGTKAVIRKSDKHQSHLGMRLRLDLADAGTADYAFDIAVRPREAFKVARERCIVQTLQGMRHEFEIKNGKFVREVSGIRPRLKPDRLALTVLSALEEFRPIFDFLTNTRRYNLHPERLRELQDPDPNAGAMLLSDGSNAAAVLRRLTKDSSHNGHVYDRICRLLGKVAPGTIGVRPKKLGQKETLEFRQAGGQQSEWRFDALNMSDGTLRTLGILLAVYQSRPAPLVAIEEPESTIFPAAIEILTEILLDGSERSQVVLTTHSPEVLDSKRLSDNQIFAIEFVQGTAQITPLAKTTREIIRQRIYTAGELLRQGELEFDRGYVERTAQQLNLFGSVEEV
jgi:predicted ATPase